MPRRDFGLQSITLASFCGFLLNLSCWKLLNVAHSRLKASMGRGFDVTSTLPEIDRGNTAEIIRIRTSVKCEFVQPYHLSNKKLGLKAPASRCGPKNHCKKLIGNRPDKNTSFSPMPEVLPVTNAQLPYFSLKWLFFLIVIKFYHYYF